MLYNYNKSQVHSFARFGMFWIPSQNISSTPTGSCMQSAGLCDDRGKRFEFTKHSFSIQIDHSLSGSRDHKPIQTPDQTKEEVTGNGGNNMKKKLAGLVLTTMVASTLASCAAGAGKKNTTAAAGGEAPQGDPKATITVQAEKEWKPYYEAAIKKVLEKYPESKITIKEIGAFDHLNVIDKTGADNADVADVFSLPSDRLPSLITKAALAPLPATEMSTVVGGYDDFAKYGDSFKDQNDYLAYPMNIETLIAFVNPVNAKTLGLDATKPVEMNDTKGIEVGVQAHNAWQGLAMANSADLTLLKKEGDKPVSDLVKPWAELGAEKQAVVSGLFAYWQKVSKNNPSIWDKDAAAAAIEGEFKDGGKTALIIDGPWATPNLIKNAPTLEIKTLDQITLNGKPLKHWKNVWGLGINSKNEKDAAKMQLSQELIKELVNPKNAESFFKTTGKIMPNVAPDVYEKTALSANEKATIKATIESYGKASDRPIMKEWDGVWDSWQNALLSWNNTKPANAEAAYKALQDSFKAMMGSL